MRSGPVALDVSNERRTFFTSSSESIISVYKWLEALLLVFGRVADESSIFD